LVSSLAVELVFTVLIFMSDAEISRRQKAEIVELETQIAPRRITSDERQHISMSLASSSGRVKVISYTADLEGGILAWQIASCLEAVKTINVDRAFASVVPLGGFGVGVL